MSESTKSDAIDAGFYEDPANLEPDGAPVRPTVNRSALTSHVPIRFSGATIAKVKTLAVEDGVTVSSWVRRLVEREADRRLSTRNQTAIHFGGVLVPELTSPKPSTETCTFSWELLHAG